MRQRRQTTEGAWLCGGDVALSIQDMRSAVWCCRMAVCTVMLCVMGWVEGCQLIPIGVLEAGDAALWAWSGSSKLPAECTVIFNT